MDFEVLVSLLRDKGLIERSFGSREPFFSRQTIKPGRRIERDEHLESSVSGDGAVLWRYYSHC